MNNFKHYDSNQMTLSAKSELSKVVETLDLVNAVPWACQANRIDVLDYFLDTDENFFKFINQYTLIHLAIQYKSLDTLKWLQSRVEKLHIEYQHVRTMLYSHLFDMLDWLIDNHSFDACFAKLDICFDTVILNYLLSKRTQIKIIFESDLLRLASIMGYIYFLDWYWDHRHELGWQFDHELGWQFDHECIDRTTYHSLEWWYKKYQLGEINFEYTEKSIDNALKYSNIDIIRWWISHSEFELKYSPIDLSDCSHNMFHFLLTEQKVIPIKIEKNLINDISRKDQFPYKLEFLFQNRAEFGFEYTVDSIDCAYTYHILEWWYEHRDELELKYTNRALDRVFSKMYYQDYYQITDWWYEKRFELKSKFTKTLFLVYITEYPIANERYVDWIDY